MEKKYKLIEILEEGIFPTKIRVIYEDDTEKEIIASEENKDTKDNECYKAISDFANQEGYIGLPTEFMEEYPDLVKKISPESLAPAEGDEEEIDNNKKKRNGIKITAIALASLIGISGVAYTLHDIFVTKKKGTVPPTPTNPPITNEYNGNITAIPEIAPTVTPLPTQAPVVEKQTSNDVADETNTFTERIDEIVTNSEEVENGLTQVIDGETQSTKKLEDALSNQMALAWSNMSNISNYINGDKLTGSVYNVNFRGLYTFGTVDYYAVDRYNLLRDNIIYYAYTEKDKAKTKSAVEKFNKAFVEFVFGNKKLYNEPLKRYYTFDDLSSAAQNTIIDLGMGVLTIEHDFNITVDGEKYNRMHAIEETGKLKEQVYEDILVQQDFYKSK